MTGNNITHQLRRAVQIYRSDGLRELMRSVVRLIERRFKRRFRHPIGYTHYIRHRLIDRLRYGNSLADPYKTITIRPEEVERMRVPNFFLSFSRFGTYILDGDWDKAYSDERIGRKFYESEKVGKFENYQVYQSVKQWMEEDLDWEETWWYQTRRDHKGAEAAAAKREKLCDLVESIKQNGYQTQRELIEHNTKRFTPWSVPPEHDEIVVNIGRDGEILFDDGTHRLCIAKVLGIDEVPVRVLIRHEKWQKKRYEMSNSNCVDNLCYELTNYLDHPDMQDVRPNR